MRRFEVGDVVYREIYDHHHLILKLRYKIKDSEYYDTYFIEGNRVLKNMWLNADFQNSPKENIVKIPICEMWKSSND